MASWADTQIPNFNPYIQQLPVEAMSYVGMEKQRRYDVGVERIQNAIDKVAGLDVIRPVDKSYIQTKLDSLNKKLRLVSAGDFSNYQLVNSVGGLVGNISKDANIVDAITSTLAYKKDLSNMEAAIKEGKSSPDNEAYFKHNASKWMNGSQPGEQYNSSYQQYSDWRKRAMEAIKGLTGDESITDDAFAGFDKNGNPIIADATVRTKLAGKSSERIKQAILSSLTPADMKQLEIEGWYTYSNLDDASFATRVKTDYDGQLLQLQERKALIEATRTTTTSPVVMSQIDNTVSDIDRAIEKIKSEYDGVLSLINSGRTDAAKSTLHSLNAINGIANSFAYSQTSITLHDNVYAKIDMDRQKFEADERYRYTSLAQQERHHQDDLRVKAEELRLKAKETEGLGGMGGLPYTIDQSELPEVDVHASIRERRIQLDNDEAIFLKTMGKDKGWLAVQEQSYTRNPNGVHPLVKEYFTKVKEIRRDIYADQQMMFDVSDEARRLYPNDLVEQNNYIDEQVKKRMSTSQGVAYGITLGNAFEKADASDLLLRVYDLAQSRDGNLAESPDLDVDVLKKIASSPVGLSITVVEGTEMQPSMYEISALGKDGETTKFRMTPEQKRAVFGNKFEPSNGLGYSRKYTRQITKMGGFSTALGKGGFLSDHPYLGNIDFPNVGAYGITGNVVASKSGGYLLQLAIFDPVTKKWTEDISFPKGGILSEEKLGETMLQLNDDYIFQILNGKRPTQGDLNKVKEATKTTY